MSVIGGTEPAGSGGLLMVDFFNDGAQTIIPRDPTAPEWRKVPHGFSLRGICNNFSSVAVNRTIYCSKGFGVFDMMKLQTRCPMCHWTFQEKSIGFNNCFSQFVG